METLKLLLTNVVGEQGNVEILKFNSESDYKARLRLKLQGSEDNYNSQCNEWVQKFSTVSKSQWVVRNTWPHLQRMAFRKMYYCHHTSVNKVKQESRKRQFVRQKGRDCDASIDIKIKKVNKDTIRNDPFLKLGLSTDILISFHHNHLVHVAEAYSFLRMSDETKQLFIQYFEDGSTPAASKHMHEMKLLTDHCADGNQGITKILADSQINPKEREINYLYDTWRNHNYGDRTLQSVVLKLEEKKNHYKEMGVEIYIQKDPLIILIVTPIMKRVHEQGFAGDVCFVDSSGSCDQTATVITFLMSASKTGGIPLACLLHTSQTEEDYAMGFQMLRNAMPNGFGGNGAPNIFMTDDSSAERSALKKVYPESKLLLCIFHVCQAVWRWLWDTKNNIPKEDRKTLMMDFRSVLYATNEIDCQEHYEELIKSCKYENFANYLNNLWERRTAWCLCYRKDYRTRGHNTNNIVEASIRVLKDIILQRCKTFNAVALLEFIVNILEKYHFRRLISHANYRHAKNEILYTKLNKSAAALTITKVDEAKYYVASSNDSQVLYTVLLDCAICDCASGAGGAYCKHLCAVQTKSDKNIVTCPSLTSEDRRNMVYIATGEHSNQFWKGMDDTDTEHLERGTENNQCFISNTSNGVRTSREHEIIEYENNDYDTNKERAQALEKLKTEFVRLLLLAKNGKCSAMVINKYAESLKKIETSSQLSSYFTANNKKHLRNGKQIAVQPTSRSRRVYRSGLKQGGKRAQSGRPAKKRKHALITNILNNVPNAKIH